MKEVGFVTENEKNQIATLYERKLALDELEETLSNDSLDISLKKLLISKIETDKQKTNEKFNRWWANKNIKYKWKSNEDSSMLSIDFGTNKIYTTK
ncbi:CXXX repeat peptide modification system protein [Clostridium sp. Marseille-Q7071]